MASSKARTRPVRTLVVLGVLILAVFATIFTGTQVDPKSDDNPGGASWAPGLALDLEGGTQLILEPVTEPGYEVTDEDINQSIAVIRQRIDSSGVSEAEITRQGDKNIVVGIPGDVSDETIQLIVTPAQMNFRPVLQVGSPVPASAAPTAEPTEGATDAPAATDGASEAPSDGATEQSNQLSDGAGAKVASAAEAAAATAEGKDAATQAATADPADGETAAPADGATTAPSDDATAPADGSKAADPSDLSQITPEVQKEFDALSCVDDTDESLGKTDDPDSVLVTCADDGTAKYILGPVEIAGTEIDSATSGIRQQNGASTGEYVVNIKFTSKGTEEFADSTQRLYGLPAPQNAFAMVLDGKVISAPTVNEPIPNGQAEISGNFTRDTSATLANQLNFGALPLTFDVQSQEKISATLGADQLEKGLIAGLIGLLLVAIYSLFQYRALGLVTLASLMVASVITYGVITLLSWTQGYRLSLPGVAGLIVAIGITADSFIVYFERIRDELRDGRGLVGAVERGWDRARRTIVASDTVNFLAAAILYLLAVGGVRGFAFTLGLTTIVDLVVVFMFTHPVMQLLARTKFFGEGHRGSGLDPRRLGVSAPRYAGRGRVSRPAGAPDVADAGPAAAEDAPAGTQGATTRRTPVPAGVGASAPDGTRMTIADRRAAARRAEAASAADAVQDAPQDDAPTEDGPPERPDGPATGPDQTATNEEKH
ncbi:protein translocase subunit SecD [Cellulomonas sp. PhB143]|uniref:protein translocase subunit SecD n=1 Tax=Cellulomonas sp. PhB143 TaxID=2485186 RepID=UPI000F487AFA|nr:protein translocase subunit SecD [Cellulomonas sp. PhB143]ROS74579.1 preprotein translocase subunit SecD [Cellulomonas sp. PhB143]